MNIFILILYLLRQHFGNLIILSWWIHVWFWIHNDVTVILKSNASLIFSKIYVIYGGVRGIMVTVVTNGHGDTSSSPEPGILHFLSLRYCELNYHDQKIRRTPTHDKRKHWTAVSTLSRLISSVYRNIHHWRSNQRPQIAVPKFYNWAPSSYRTQVTPNQLVMVIARPLLVDLVSLVSDMNRWLSCRVSALQSVVAGSISSGENYGIHCWRDLIRSKQQSNVPIYRA